ncbi:hypothetical protein L1987_54146 [Smallanthus sonchifolius]|uniref:Uncharacterized protein n=1 Tax=Smallanthus sonchifolius TaxID=185202 RepID=A0ACB9E5Z4_9ASTR|nr:hypothetical protein L1987_54146 [Smallanthus sonchifolius]
MELQLTLSLSSSSSSCSSFSQVDLNNYSHENVDANDMCECMKREDLKKRKLCVFGDDDGFHAPKTLPFLFCNKSKQENDDDDDDDDDDDVVDGDGDDFSDAASTFIFINHKIGGEENEVVGWPPVKSIRKNLPRRSGGCGGGRSKSMFVKVQMEGDGIARKIDLNLHRNEDVQLTYQDKEGDWLLAGDIPWGSFIDTAHRLKLLKCNR